ncbi:MAG: hypothetical protein LBM60_07790 [Clostridium sp.]|jgi:hypothetical protein|nr:hypothetical protein [Clostridium sp.]
MNVCKNEFMSILSNNYEFSDPYLKQLLYGFKSALEGKDIEESNKLFFIIQNHIEKTFEELSISLFYVPKEVRPYKMKKRIFKKRKSKSFKMIERYNICIKKEMERLS